MRDTYMYEGRLRAAFCFVGMPWFTAFREMAMVG